MKKPIITDITAHRKVEIKSVECGGCGLPATLNGDGLCTHCVIRPHKGAVSGPTIIERVRAWLHRSGDAEPLTGK